MTACDITLFYMWYKSCIVMNLLLVENKSADLTATRRQHRPLRCFLAAQTRRRSTHRHEKNMSKASRSLFFFFSWALMEEKGLKAFTLVKQIINSELHSVAEHYNWNSLIEAVFTGNQCFTAVEHFHFLVRTCLFLQIHERPNRICCSFFF